MDIYSSSKNPKHKKTNKKDKKNIFIRIKEWFLNMSVKKRAIIISLLAILLVLILLISIILGYIVKWMVVYNYDEEFKIEVEPISEDTVNIALFGIDYYEKTEQIHPQLLYQLRHRYSGLCHHPDSSESGRSVQLSQEPVGACMLLHCHGHLPEPDGWYSG